MAVTNRLSGGRGAPRGISQYLNSRINPGKVAMKDFNHFFKSLLAAGAFLLAVLPMQTHAVSGDRFDIYGLIDVQGVFHRDAQTSWLRQGAQADFTTRL